MSARGWIAGVGSWVAMVAAVSYFSGPTTCRDGWASSSIGSRGACSHHGGVDRSGDAWAKLLIAPAAIIGIAVADFGTKAPTPPRMPPAPPLQPLDPDRPVCPKCSRSMVRRTAKRGRNPARTFWGCPNHPYCRETMRMDADPRGLNSSSNSHLS
ncbi:hypothetical protein CA235_11275 [Sphingomonas sp. ABOLF]|nr:hypothetical protein CA235_11275 [Sphingomonas sp. ABOLF]